MTLPELLEMQSNAARLAQQIQLRFTEGELPNRIVPLLKQQAETIALFQASLKAYVPNSVDREDLDTLKAKFSRLVESTDETYKAVAKKGIRLTGIGGKPYTSNQNKSR
jgi:hypothetical protein